MINDGEGKSGNGFNGANNDAEGMDYIILWKIMIMIPILMVIN